MSDTYQRTAEMRERRAERISRARFLVAAEQLATELETIAARKAAQHAAEMAQHDRRAQ